jgi:hypothetical protein
MDQNTDLNVDPDTDPNVDPDPAIFVIGHQDVNKKLIFSAFFLWLFLFEGTLTSFFKIKNTD